MESDNEPLKALKTPRWPLVVGLVVLAVGGYLAYRVLFEPRGQPEATEVEPDAGPPPPADAGPELSIDEGDEKLGAALSSLAAEPALLKWLEGFGLRRLVAAAQLVADGESPRASVPFTIDGPFLVREEAPPATKAKGKRRAARPPGRLFIDPKSYQRYDEVTALATAVSPAALGDAYATLRPYFQAAFKEIGRPGARFDDVLAAAIGRLTAVRFPEGEVELVPAGAMYAFKDEGLEGLSKAQKHLLRMGPKNGAAIQAALQTFATHAHLEVPAPAGAPGQ